MDPNIGFAIARLVPKVVKKEEDQFAVRRLACAGLVQALDAAFVSAGQQDLPVSEYFKANPALHDLCKDIFNLSQEVRFRFHCSRGI